MNGPHAFVRPVHFSRPLDNWKRAEVAQFGWKQAGEADKAAKDYYAEWSKSMGVNSSIKTLAEYYDVKYNDPPRYELLSHCGTDAKKCGVPRSVLIVARVGRRYPCLL